MGRRHVPFAGGAKAAEAATRLQSGITPEEKRRTEIKAGVITATGSGVAILLYFLMQGIILSGRAAGSRRYLAAYGLPE
jgi:hypothetical protein